MLKNTCVQPRNFPRPHPFNPTLTSTYGHIGNNFNFTSSIQWWEFHSKRKVGSQDFYQRSQEIGGHFIPSFIITEYIKREIVVNVLAMSNIRIHRSPLILLSNSLAHMAKGMTHAIKYTLERVSSPYHFRNIIFWPNIAHPSTSKSTLHEKKWPLWAYYFRNSTFHRLVICTFD